MALADRLRMQRRPHLHRWVRVSNEGWVFARCTRCRKERELYSESFLRSFGDRPPPLHIPGM
jgi:hypothetical protein